MAFHLTTAAAQEILAAAQRSGAAGMALRVAAKATPGGLAYGMGFDEAAPDDEVAVFEGLTVLIAPASREWLAGTVLDFVELDGGGRDFIFVQPESADKSGSETNFADHSVSADRPPALRAGANLDSDPDFSEPRGCSSGSCSRCG
jgi:iron-sulfur cluster assembly protein